MKNENYILFYKSAKMDFEPGLKPKTFLGMIVCYHSSSLHWKHFNVVFLTSLLQDYVQPVPSTGYLGTENSTVGKLGSVKHIWFPDC